MIQVNPLLDQQTASEIITNPSLRAETAKTLLGFGLIYLPHYFTLTAAEFHPELIQLLGDWNIPFLSVTGFRGSAKSTFAGLILPLYAALEGKNKFIILVNETDDVVKLTIANIREELENNEMIRLDFGNMIKGGPGYKTKFSETNIVLSNGTRIMGRSRGQKIRGLRHRQYRPDMVIIDDAEEREKVQKKEYRDKTERWLTGDIIPACEENRIRLVVIGNELHTDALMARLRVHPIFEHREYPLVNGEGKTMWLGKYPTPESLVKQEMKVGHTAYLREYLLKVVPPEGQVIKEEWLKYYEHLPKESAGKSGVGVDLAISEKETADYTAMVSGILSIENGMPKIYVLPGPINEHLTFFETQEQMKSLHLGLRIYAHPTFYIEDVAYQKAAIQEAQRMMLSTQAIKPGKDKRGRLKTAAMFIQNGTVLFPRSGAEDLINQLTDFGITEHDDLADAFVYLVLGLSEEGMQMPEVIALF